MCWAVEGRHAGPVGGCCGHIPGGREGALGGPRGIGVEFKQGSARLTLASGLFSAVLPYDIRPKDSRPGAQRLSSLPCSAHAQGLEA